MLLALPMAKILKEKFPGIKVFFLGREYTRPIVNACIYCDGFIELDEFLKGNPTIDGKPIEIIIHVKPESYVAKRAKQLKIKKRIGTTNRLYHWTTCNKLVPLSRKKSNLHEAQLNLKLLSALGINKNFSLKDVYQSYGFENLKPLQEEYAALIDRSKYNLILHPKSRGSAREWGLGNFTSLIRTLDKSKYKIFISGTGEEKKLMQSFLDDEKDNVTDITGMMKLEQFISFINYCDALVACSTGPLHIAAALGKDALGIYVPLHSLRPERWEPVGKNAEVFVLNKYCVDCYKNKMPCHCVQEISPVLIKESLDKRALSNK